MGEETDSSAGVSVTETTGLRIDSDQQPENIVEKKLDFIIAAPLNIRGPNLHFLEATFSLS